MEVGLWDWLLWMQIWCTMHLFWMVGLRCTCYKKGWRQRLAQMGDITHPSAGEERAGRVTWAIQKVISVQLQTDIPRYRTGRNHHSTQTGVWKRQGADAQRANRQTKRERQGKSKVRTVRQSTRTKCRHNQVKRPSKQERKQESKERKIRLVFHIHELTKEGKKSGLKLKKRSISWTTDLGGRNVKITRKSL